MEKHVLKVSKEETPKIIEDSFDSMDLLLENRHLEISKVNTIELDPPEGGCYGWVMVASSFCCSMVVDGSINCFGVFLSALVKEFGESEGKIVLIGSMVGGLTMLFGPLASALTNKYGCRITCIIGGIISSASFAISVFCPTVAWFGVVYFCCGVGMSLIYLPSVVNVGYYFKSNRMLVTGIAESGSGFGTCVFPPLANYIVITKGWKTANLCLSIITLSSVLCGALMKPVKRKIVPNGYHNELELFPLSSSVRNEQKQSVVGVKIDNLDNNTEGEKNVKPILDLKLLRDLKFLLLGLSNIFGIIAYYIPFMFIVECAKTDNIEAEQASFLVSTMGIVYVVFQLIFGYIANFSRADSLLVTIVCFIIGTVTFVSIPFCVTYTSYIFATVFLGVAIAGYVTLTPMVLVDLFGLEKLASGFGIILCIRGVATFLGFLAIGAIFDATQSSKSLFFIGAGLFILAAIFTITLLHLKRKCSVER